MFRCQVCGRPINRPMKTPGDRMPFCGGAKRCNKTPLPRCLVCHGLYKQERQGSKQETMCTVAGKGRPHTYSLDGVKPITAKDMEAIA